MSDAFFHLEWSETWRYFLAIGFRHDL